MIIIMLPTVVAQSLCDQIDKTAVTELVLYYFDDTTAVAVLFVRLAVHRGPAV